MRRLCTWIQTLAVFAIFAGCASAPLMPLADSDPKPDTNPPLYLMTVTVKNTYKERWQPNILNVILTKNTEGGKSESRVFRMDSKGTIAAKTDADTTVFLVRLRVSESFNTLTGMNAMASAFPIHGFYFLPLYASLGSDGPGVYYLGSVQATIRERKDNEFRAGPVIPLIDQAVAGASSGTFDVTIVDRFDQDIELFKSTFPALNGTLVVKKILSTWDRSKAQLEWEKS